MSDQIEREQQIEEESLTKNSLQIQKAAWIREELEKRRAQEDQLLQQILREQQMLQELDEDMDQNMAHAKEGRIFWGQTPPQDSILSTTSFFRRSRPPPSTS